MPFSHHSHSGQYCPGHARNTLEEMVQTAIGLKMHTMALTEHMPRGQEDFYPEERPTSTEQGQVELMDRFHAHATELRARYAGQIEILVGFEAEWIRASSLGLISELQRRHAFDFFIGSVHHVLTRPIDYDRASYEAVRALLGGSDERVFEEYFDAQYAMLQTLRPRLVGHFDLIRLYSDEPDGRLQRWDGVWDRVVRNLGFVAGYGGVLELNSAALRKGMAEPYPKVEICQVFHGMGGSFALSDDSHGTEQVGLNYRRVLAAIRQAGIHELVYFTRRGGSHAQGGGVATISTSTISIPDLEALPFWASPGPEEA